MTFGGCDRQVEAQDGVEGKRMCIYNLCDGYLQVIVSPLDVILLPKPSLSLSQLVMVANWFTGAI